MSKLIDFSYIGQKKYNPEDDTYYVLEYSTRNLPISAEQKKKNEKYKRKITIKKELKNE